MVPITPFFIAVLFLLGVVTGGLSNVTSGGAGIFTIYFLTAYVGLAIQQSTGTVLAASTVIVLIGALSFLRKGQVNKQLGLTVGLSGVAAAFVAAKWAASIKSATLEEAFGTFTLALALYTAARLAMDLRSRRGYRVALELDPAATPTEAPPLASSPAAPPARQTRWTGTDAASLAIQISKGVFIGFATGLFGVGLASLSVLLFMLLFRLDLKMILGTSLVASFMRYLGGSVGYLTSGLVNPFYLTILVAGGTVGSLAGARFILRSGRRGRGRWSMDIYVKLIVIGILLFVSYQFLLKKFVP